jgi:hypothetical protein
VLLLVSSELSLDSLLLGSQRLHNIGELSPFTAKCGKIDMGQNFSSSSPVESLQRIHVEQNTASISTRCGRDRKFNTDVTNRIKENFIYSSTVSLFVARGVQKATESSITQSIGSNDLNYCVELLSVDAPYCNQSSV